MRHIEESRLQSGLKFDFLFMVVFIDESLVEYGVPLWSPTTTKMKNKNKVSNLVEKVDVKVLNKIHEQIWTDYRNKIWNQMCRQIRNNIGNQVHDEVYTKVKIQIWGLIYSRVMEDYLN